MCDRDYPDNLRLNHIDERMRKGGEHEPAQIATDNRSYIGVFSYQPCCFLNLVDTPLP